MYVRLAFAVAAHLEPEILLVDEVLAVGDAEFQKKCLGKMGEVARGGRTVLFVSHDMGAVQSLCPRAIVLKEGILWFDGVSADSVAEYLKTSGSELGPNRAYSVRCELLGQDNGRGICITDVSLLSTSGETLHIIQTGDSLILRIEYRTSRSFVSPAFVVSLRSNTGQEVFRLSTMPISGYQIDALGSSGRIDLRLESLPVTAGLYYIDVSFARERIEWILRLERLITINVQPRDIYDSGMALDQSRGLIVIPHRWEHVPYYSNNGE